MGLLDGFSGWFVPPWLELYRCSNCGDRFAEGQPSCPNCGGDVEADEAVAYNWDWM